ncbi:DNA polymerase IV [bacterium]|nr:DNA polymerase IV [bacterium]
MERDRIILHIDMDAFFASVEQRCRPYLMDKPVAVIGSGARTVVTTASYQARKYGVKTGMTAYEARKMCPMIHLVTVDNRKYTDTSCRIVKIFQMFTPLVEVFSIDEAFLDITGSISLFGSPESIAGRIKACINKDLGLTCSVGIGPNKLLAKLASGAKKPDGLFRIRPCDVQGLMDGLSVEELCGIGTRLAISLEHLGIKTCGQLGRMPLCILTRRFGVIGERLKAMAQGKDYSPVIPIGEEPEAKSVGHSMTLDRDIMDKSDILCYLLHLSQMVGRRARAYRVAGRTVTLTVRYADFHTFTIQKTVSRAINGSQDIWNIAADILSDISLMQPVRLLGVSLSNLFPLRARQLSLFESSRRQEEVCAVMDKINDRYGEGAIIWGMLLPYCLHGSRIISPSWRPKGIRKVNVK